MARKAHTCCECQGTIQCGETYEHAKGIWEGEAGEFKTCHLCDNLRQDVCRDLYEDEYPAFGELGAECREFGGEFEERFEAIRAKAPK